MGASHLGKLGDRDTNMDANTMPVVALRNLISHEQAADTGTFSFSKILQSHALPLPANNEMQAFNRKREVDSVSKKEATLRASVKDLNQDAKKVKNNTKTVESKAAKSDKTVHHKSEQHANRTRYTCRTRCRPDLGDHTTGVPVKGISLASNRKLNLTGSYGVLKLLSKENLVRIVNSQMQSIPSLSFPGKGSRSRKRDLIDVNHGQLDAQKVQRQDIAVTQFRTVVDNQTALPDLSPVTVPDHNQDQADSAHNPLSEVNPALSRGQTTVGLQASDGRDMKSKHLVRLLSTPHSEVSFSPEREAITNQTELPLTSTKHFPLHVPSETNDSLPPVLTMQPLGVRGGAVDSHRDPLTQSFHTAQTELSTAHYPLDEDNKLVNSSHVLRLHPAHEWSYNARDTATQAAESEPGKGLVFEEAEEDAEQMERKGPRSRSRRSWIWNQFFVIEEYAGPEPVLIGRVSERTNFIHHLQRL